ncbi:hypothetical protein GSH19_01010 [Lactobacillus sp. S2-2]|uniref:prepilin peptidase n=1 Tax=Lactobacillus sp. S2-2 TaxID=2692917 RepID=UPI001F8A8D5D|nr:hypothetical protein [Lactobacillus sp. S2-2]
MIIYIFIIGTVIGSFLNLMVERIIRKESFIFERSKCLGCNQQIPEYCLVPILSYILLRGKCLNCKIKIPSYFPLFEFIYGINTLIFYMTENILFFSVTTILHLISISDILTKRFPCQFSWLLIIIAIINTNFNYLEVLITCIIGLLISKLGFLDNKIGNGDIDLIIVLILIFNLLNASIIIFISSLSALIYLLLNNKLRIIPFIPFIYFGTIVFLVLSYLKFSLY